MIKISPFEKFLEIELIGPLRLRYAISNFGRLISFSDQIENGRIVKGSLIDGYRIFRYKVRIDGKISNKHAFFYRLVAENFLKKENEDAVYVLHLNRCRDQDHYMNLRWATKEQMLEHQRNSPYVIEAKKNLALHKTKTNGYKLSATTVMFIKKKLLDPTKKIKIKTLARKFGISEMQLYRIKRGENWGHIIV
jgi:hypothetical protein